MTRSDRQPRRRLDPGDRADAILTAAAEAFATQSYEEVTVDRVARAAGSSAALVYRYFPGKAELYAAVVRLAVDDLVAAQRAVLAELAPGVPVRDRVRAATLVYLDHVAHHPHAWARPLRAAEPEPAAAVRRAARAAYVDALAAMLASRDSRRHEYALWGYFGFLDTACLRWVDLGCPDADRHPLTETALGALEGALGDWDA